MYFAVSPKGPLLKEMFHIPVSMRPALLSKLKNWDFYAISYQKIDFKLLK